MKKCLCPSIVIMLVLSFSYSVVSNIEEDYDYYSILSSELEIRGPDHGRIGVVYNYSFNISNLQNCDFYLYVQWGDGDIQDWIGPFNPVDGVVLNHSWAVVDTYSLYALARICNNTEYTAEKDVKIIKNLPPYPPRISGPISVKVGIDYKYTFVSWAIDYTDIRMFVDWGDGTSSGWTGYYESLEPITFSHEWCKKGTYIIKAKSQDRYGLESDWGVLKVSMPRFSNIFHYNILEKFPLFYTYLGRFIC